MDIVRRIAEFLKQLADLGGETWQRGQSNVIKCEFLKVTLKCVLCKIFKKLEIFARLYERIIILDFWCSQTTRLHLS